MHDIHQLNAEKIGDIEADLHKPRNIFMNILKDIKTDYSKYCHFYACGFWCGRFGCFMSCLNISWSGYLKDIHLKKTRGMTNGRYIKKRNNTR